MVKACPNKVDECLPCDDSPIVNLSAEGADYPYFLGIAVVARTPNLGDDDLTPGCASNCWALGSQTLADLCALWQAQNCANPGGIGSAAFSGTYTCPGGGGTFHYAVPAGAFHADTQGHADALAQSFADHLAETQSFCCGMPPTLCFGSDFLLNLGLTGGVPPFVYTLLDGALPTGVSLSPSGELSGTLVATGVFSWTIRVTDSSGTGVYLDWPFTLRVIGIANATLLPTFSGQAYTDSLIMDGAAAAVLWYIIDGALPAGLVLDTELGTITGTTVVADGDYPVTIRGIYADGTFCDKAFQLTVGCAPCRCAIPDPLDPIPTCFPRVNGIWYNNPVCYTGWGFCEYWDDTHLRVLRRVYSAFPYTPLGWMHFDRIETGSVYIDVYVSGAACVVSTVVCNFVAWHLWSCDCWMGTGPDSVIYVPDLHVGTGPCNFAAIPAVTCPSCPPIYPPQWAQHTDWNARAIFYAAEYVAGVGPPGSFYWYDWPIYKVSWMTVPSDEPYGTYDVSGDRYAPGNPTGVVLNPCNYPYWDTQFVPVVVEKGIPPP